MKVSIITVSFNAAKTISATLSSVATQTYPNIEHIVVDGGSSDGTQEIVKKFQHVTHFISEKDEGLYFAMNKGLSIATGEIVVMLNADDEYAHNSIIEKVVSCFEQYQVDSVYGDLVYVNANNSKVIRNWKAGHFNRNKFYQGWMVPHPTFFVKRECYQKWGCFNTSLKYAADYELMLRFMFKHHITNYYLPETLVIMKSGGKSNASFLNRFYINREDRRAWTINHLQPHLFTLILKPLRKLTQYINL
jgi:glycosyltransferase involved in cell wall biosynthesis